MQNSSQINIKNIVFIIFLLVLLYLFVNSIEIIIMLFTTFVVVCAINPLIDKMSTKMPRTLAAGIILLAGISVFFIIIIPLLKTCIKEAVAFASTFSLSFDQLNNVLNFKIFNKTLSDFVTIDSIKEPLTTTVTGIFENTITAGKSIAGFFATLMAIAIMVFYYSCDVKRINDKFIEFFPVEHKDTAKKILNDIESRVGGYVVAQGLCMLFVGVIVAIGLILAGHHHAILLGFITFVLDIIPVVGPTIAGILIVLSSLQSGVMAAVVALIIIVVAQWAENQFIRPILFGKFLNMHPLMIIVSLLLCAKFFGFWGIVLAPAIASVICVVVDELYLSRINKV